MKPMGARRIGVIGTGVIGSSWASLFLSRGCHIDVWDPSPYAEAGLREFITNIAALGDDTKLQDANTQEKICFHPSAEAAVESAEFVQENGPENLDIKAKLFTALDEAAPQETIIASSSSTLMPSDLQRDCKGACRVLVGHPFNPPHVIPLVEVVAGIQTQPWAIEKAMRFYSDLGKRPVLLKREVRGHIANRLQAALWQEALYLIREGIADVSDVDAAITFGPGLRWAVMGPIMGLHLSGGADGAEGLFEKPLWREVEQIWSELGRISVDKSLSKRVGEQLAVELAGQNPNAIGRECSQRLQQIIDLSFERYAQ